MLFPWSVRSIHSGRDLFGCVHPKKLQVLHHVTIRSLQGKYFSRASVPTLHTAPQSHRTSTRLYFFLCRTLFCCCRSRSSVLQKHRPDRKRRIYQSHWDIVSDRPKIQALIIIGYFLHVARLTDVHFSGSNRNGEISVPVESRGKFFFNKRRWRSSC